MRLLKICLWGGGLVALWGAAAFLTDRFQIGDRLLAVFLTFSPSLSPWWSFEKFLAALVVACVLIVLVLFAITMGSVTVLSGQILRTKHERAAQEVAVERAVERLRAQVQQEYQRLIGLSDTLTQRLDKRALLQNILQATGQITSIPQVDSAVSVWALDFATEQIQFEIGARCDASFFTKTQFELTEPPFRRFLASRQVQCFQKWDECGAFVVGEKAARLGQANALMLIPLIIERTLLGCLVVFCHSDLLRAYEQQQTFFNAAWGQLALALSIAIQGELAILDRLTGMVNQTYFLQRLAQEIERSNRYQQSLSVLMIDIDDFKMVNDTLGHPQGDAVLKIVAKLIKHEVRVIDLVARYGGEEFIVMLPETGLAEEAGGSVGALVVAERIRKAVELEFQELQKPLSVTVSIGLTVRRYPQDRQRDTREVIRLADEQLYKAKTSGKNRCCVYTPEEAESVT